MRPIIGTNAPSESKQLGNEMDEGVPMLIPWCAVRLLVAIKTIDRRRWGIYPSYGPQAFVYVALVFSHRPSHIPSHAYINEHRILAVRKWRGGWMTALDRGLCVCSSMCGWGLYGQEMDLRKRNQGAQDHQGSWNISEHHWNTGVTKQNPAMLARTAWEYASAKLRRHETEYCQKMRWNSHVRYINHCVGPIYIPPSRSGILERRSIVLLSWENAWHRNMHARL